VPLSLALWLAVGCGGGSSKPGSQVGDGDGDGDGDGELGMDAAVVDGGAATDERDAAASLDAGEVGSDGGVLSECRGDVLSFEAAQGQGPTFHAGMNGNRLELVYLEATCGGTPAHNYTQGLLHVSVETSGAASAPEGVVNHDACYGTRDPALVAASKGYQLFYTASNSGAYELYFLDASKKGATPAQETQDSDHNEFAVTAAEIAGKLRVAYSRDLPYPAAENAAADLVNAPQGGAPTSVVAASDGFHAARIAMAPLGAATSGGRAGVVAWVSDSTAHPGVFLRFIDAEGHVVGKTQTLSTSLGSASQVALAPGDSGAVVVYTVGDPQQIRFRVLGVDGAVGDEVSLSVGNQDVRDLAIAPYSVGYVVAYRRFGMGGDDQASIHLLFINEQGNIGRTRLVAPATTSGQGLQVFVGQDGRILPVWVDTEALTDDAGMAAVTSRVFVGRLECP
jgi:hypothetical protein